MLAEAKGKVVTFTTRLNDFVDLANNIPSSLNDLIRLVKVLGDIDTRLQ